jgi:hypothetical protein
MVFLCAALAGTLRLQVGAEVAGHLLSASDNAPFSAREIQTWRLWPSGRRQPASRACSLDHRIVPAWLNRRFRGTPFFVRHSLRSGPMCPAGCLGRSGTSADLYGCSPSPRPRCAASRTLFQRSFAVPRSVQTPAGLSRFLKNAVRRPRFAGEKATIAATRTLPSNIKQLHLQGPAQQSAWPRPFWRRACPVGHLSFQAGTDAPANPILRVNPHWRPARESAVQRTSAFGGRDQARQ